MILQALPTIRRWLITWLSPVALMAGCGSTPVHEGEGHVREDVGAAVRAVLDAQLAAWNAGDIEKFMETYWKSEDLRFASGGTVRLGWNEARERFQTTYPDPSAMGQLSFEVARIEQLGPGVAMAFGKWRLDRAAGELSGLFTLILKRIDGGWRIVHDHTSAGS